MTRSGSRRRWRKPGFTGLTRLCASLHCECNVLLSCCYTVRLQLSRERFGLDRGVSQSRAQKGWGRGGVAKMQAEQKGARPKVTLGDVAKESGVSMTTASVVISNGPAATRFPLPTRERVWRVARQLGYRPNFFARSLRQRRSQTLGVLLFDITDPYCTQILRGIESRIRSSGYFSVITDLQNNGAQFRPCIDMLLDRQVEGIIAVANPVYLAPDLFAEFVHRQIPALVIGRDLHGNPVSSIAVDNESGARQALQHIHQLGHTRIAFIKGPKALSDSERRWRGI